MQLRVIAGNYESEKTSLCGVNGDREALKSIIWSGCVFGLQTFKAQTEITSPEKRMCFRPRCALQKEVLLSDVVVCSVAYILTFAITASTVFLSLKVRFYSGTLITVCRNNHSRVLSNESVFHRVSSALRDPRAVRPGGDCGVRDPLPDPTAEEAPPLVVDFSSGSQDQGVPPV